MRPACVGRGRNGRSIVMGLAWCACLAGLAVAAQAVGWLAGRAKSR